MQYKDYYSILGLSKNASEKQIKSAYRSLARKFHPDVNKSADAAERFKDINEAYTVLSDPAKRRKYDELGSNWQAYERAGATPGAGRRTVFTSSGRAANFDFSPFFEMFFGDMRGEPHGTGVFRDLFQSCGAQTAASHQTPNAQEHELLVSLEEVARGGQRQVQIAGKSLSVSIPVGIREGAKLRIEAAKAGLTSDLMLVVRYSAHPVYKRVEDDLEVELDVPVTQAVLGGEVQVPTLYGDVTMQIPPETQAGKVFRLRGRGLPRWKSKANSDLRVRIRIVLPKPLSEQERDLFRRMHALKHK